LFAYAVNNMGPPEVATHPPAVDAVHVLPPVPAVIHEPLPEPVVEIQPIVIEARKSVPAKAKAKPAAPEPPAPTVRPCSEWRELGPAHVSKGKPTGTVSVRELCP
jgi:hypothetical protein